MSNLIALAPNAGALVDYLNTLMLHGTMSTQMRASIINAVNATSTTDMTKRAQVAVYLVATSSQYDLQR